ncbi:transducin beta-like protein 3 [Arctopsyche grandis]|uniref:transducin beta-like protein 3 n=1 Tax=Arctopsyche grandis TaxID=121162 RepID=UPI00406D6CCE
MSSSYLKEAYDVEAEYRAFYTGGQVIWTNDGNHMLCHCNDAVKAIDLNSGLVTSTFGGSEDEADEEDTIYCFALSRDNDFLITTHKSGLIKLWSMSDVKVTKMWRSIHKGPIAKVVFDGTSNTIATGGSDGTAKIWNILRQTCTHSLKGTQGVFNILTFHPDITKHLLFGSGDDTKIIAWNVESGEQISTFSGHFSKITSLNFTIDGKFMVSSGRDRVLILWDIEQGKAVRTLPVYECIEDSVILPVKFQLPDKKIKKSDGGIYVACAGDKGVIKVWDVSSSKLIYAQTNSVVSPASNDGGLAVTQLLLNEIRCCLSVISADHNIIVYDLATFECSKQMVGFTDEVLDVSYFGQSDSHIAVATNSIDIKVYDLETMNCQLVKGHGDLVLSLAKSPYNPDVLLSSSKDNSIRVWLMNNKKVQCIGIGNRHTASVGSVCLPYLDASCCFSVSQDSCIKKWQLPTINAESEEIHTLICTHTEVAHSKDINHISMSPNDKIVASGSQDKTIKLWSTEDLSLLGTLRGHKRGVWCVKFSPVDQVLLSASADCTMKLWSISELNCLKTLEGHSSSVLKAEFISKGLQIVSAGADGLMKVWNIKTSESIVTLDKHDGRVWALAVSENENHIITGGADSLLIKWKDVTTEKREKETKERQDLIMQEQELSNLLHDKKMVKALKLALKLDKPFLTLKIINELLKDDGRDVLLSTIKQLNSNQHESLAKCCVEWNTNTRNCYAAQVVLHILLSEGQLDVDSAATIRALLPYNQRHMQRLTATLQDLNFLTFTINCMQPHATSLT